MRGTYSRSELLDELLWSSHWQLPIAGLSVPGPLYRELHVLGSQRRCRVRQ